MKSIAIAISVMTVTFALVMVFLASAQLSQLQRVDTQLTASVHHIDDVLLRLDKKAGD